jgi:hypothetical protein
MDMAAWRDLVIVIWGIVASLGLIFICVLAFLFYRRISALLESGEAVAAKVADILDYADKEVIRPIIQFGAMIKGVLQGVELFKNVFNKKEEEDG